MFRPQLIDRLDYNGIINGDFDYWQRGTSWNPTAGGVSYGGPDRFCLSGGDNGDAQITRSTDTPTLAQSGHLSKYSLRLSPNSVVASPSPTAYYDLAHTIEGNYITPLIGQDVFLSFWVKSNVTGPTAVNLREGTTTIIHSYVAAYNIDQADTWEQKIIKLDFPESYSWETNTGRALFLSWNLMPEENWITDSPNTWVDGNKTSYSGMNNFFSSTQNYFQLSQVKLGINYSGANLDAMTYSHAGKNRIAELDLCRRYFHKFETRQSMVLDSTSTCRVNYDCVLDTLRTVYPSLADYALFLHTLESPEHGSGTSYNDEANWTASLDGSSRLTLIRSSAIASRGIVAFNSGTYFSIDAELS